MPDDLNSRGGQDRQRINLSEDYELSDWARKFGVSVDELRRAVAAVGDRADAVQAHLAQRGGST
ncbi:MAG: DUF3606 domain-containing protein [Burkholderiaceae bacterium]